MAMKKLYLNDVSLAQYGIFISSDTVLDAPSFDYVEHQVPGRDGTMLQYNNRLNNVVRKFTCHIPFRNKVKSGIAALKKILYLNPGYIKIASDYESGVYQYGYLAQGLNIDPFNVYRSATFDLYFSCLPQKYTTAQTQSFTNDFTFNRKFGVYHRTHPFIQMVLNDTPAEFAPTDDYFIYCGLSGGTYPFTQINCTLSEQKFVAIVADNQSYSHPLDVNTYEGFAGCGIGSVSIANYDANNADISIVCALTKGTISATAVANNTETVSLDCSQFYHSVTNSSAFGADIGSITAKYQMNFDDYPVLGNGMIIVSGYDSSVLQWQGSFSFNIADGYSDLGDELYANWLDNGDLTVQINTQGKTCNAVLNSNIYPLSNYVEMFGTFGGGGDTIEVGFFSAASLAQYQTKSADLSVEWTTL